MNSYCYTVDSCDTTTVYKGALDCNDHKSFSLSFDGRNVVLRGGYVEDEVLITWTSPADQSLDWIGSIGFGAEDQELIVVIEAESGMYVCECARVCVLAEG